MDKYVLLGTYNWDSGDDERNNIEVIMSSNDKNILKKMESLLDELIIKVEDAIDKEIMDDRYSEPTPEIEEIFNKIRILENSEHGINLVTLTGWIHEINTIGVYELEKKQ